MNIGLYVEHLHGKKTGVGQYGFNVTLNLSRLDPENHYYLFTPSPLGHAERLGSLARPLARALVLLDAGRPPGGARGAERSRP